jgi:hypothetical protein
MQFDPHKMLKSKVLPRREMKNALESKLAENEYYHGTANDSALQILYEGFRLKKKYLPYGRYGTFKQGIYLTKSLDVAALFGFDVVFKCRLAGGTSILWINECYDRRVIASLRREFTKNILTGDITKAIPHNKHLKKKELIHLLNYRYCKVASWKLRDSLRWMISLSSFREQLQRHKYDAVGELKHEDGLAVFNPTHIEPVDAFHLSRCGQEIFLQDLDKERLASEIQEMLDDLKEDREGSDKEELDYVALLLDRYRREHNLTGM